MDRPATAGSIARGIGVLALLVAAAGCASSRFDPVALEQDRALKARALSLMEKGTEDIGGYTGAIDSLTADIHTAVLYESGQKENNASLKEWSTVMDPSKNLLQDFLHRWQMERRLNESYVKEAKQRVGDVFDRIIELENEKQAK